MANQLVQYGAVVAGAAILPAATKAISDIAGAAAIGWQGGAAAEMFGISGSGVAGAMDAAASAAGSATSTALSSIQNTITNPTFLASAGLGLAGLLLGSGSKRPSLSFPNLAATAVVALNVGALLKQGQAAAAESLKSKVGAGTSLTIPGIKLKPAAYPTTTIENGLAASKTTALQYPSDLSDQYWIQLSMYKYSRALSYMDLTDTMNNPLATIKLPFPTNVLDAISLSYDSSSLGIFGGPMVNGVDKLYRARKGGASIPTVLGMGVKSARDAIESPGFTEAVLRKALNNTSLGNALSLVTGNAPNPHLAVAFNGVNLKTYSFSWRFSPNNEAESKTLENIVKQLQASSLPAKDGEFLLTFPNIVRVNLNPPNLVHFKSCVIDSIGINYVPSGTPSFYKSTDSTNARYPTELEMSITLRELDIHTASDNWYKSTVAGGIAADITAASATASAKAVGQDVDPLITTVAPASGGLRIGNP